jgi:hypothetical protein
METEAVEIPVQVGFRLLEMLREVSVRLDPPEDFKPHKFPTEEQLAKIARYYHSVLMDEMGKTLTDSQKDRATQARLRIEARKAVDPSWLSVYDMEAR